MTELQLERRNRDRALLRLLWNRPLVSLEILNALRELEEFEEWSSVRVGLQLRRLAREGKLNRLELRSSRFVLWWAG